MQPRVRNLQAGLVDRLVPVEEQIQIDRSGAAGPGTRTITTKPALELQQRVQELARRSGRSDHRDPVQEPRLIQIANGIRFAQARDQEEPRVARVIDCLHCLPDRRLSVAQVGAEPDEGRCCAFLLVLERS
jgi:hypothetical protein